jgi:hypothetical protein
MRLRTFPREFGRKKGELNGYASVRSSLREDGKITYPFGEHPLGYFVYDPTGHLSIQIMRMPARPPFASGDDNKGTNEEVRAAYDAYMAYFGTYRVDEKASILTHVVEGSLRPSYTGTEQPRPFKLDGDTLVIEIDGKKGHGYRELQRVK